MLLPPPPPTLDDGQQDDDDEEEEGDVEEHAVEFVGVTGRVFQLVTDAAAGSHTRVQVEQVTLPQGTQRQCRRDVRCVTFLLELHSTPFISELEGQTSTGQSVQGSVLYKSVYSGPLLVKVLNE